MADSDKTLEILIRLGIMGKEDLVAFTNSVYWQEIFQGANPTNFWIMPYSFLSNQ